MSDAISATGTIVAYQPTPGGAFSDIAELGGDIAFPGLSRNRIEVSTHNDRIDSHILGMLRRGEGTLPINFLRTNATHNVTTGLAGMIGTNLKTGFRITYPDGFAIIFSGGVSKFDMKAPVDGPLTADIGITAIGRMYVDGVLFGN